MVRFIGVLSTVPGKTPGSGQGHQPPFAHRDQRWTTWGLESVVERDFPQAERLRSLIAIDEAAMLRGMALTDDEIYRRTPRLRAKEAESARLDSPITKRDVRNWAMWIAGAWVLSKILDALGFSALFH
jgi:hypothetical protein